MNTEDAKKLIEASLKNMGCVDITFPEPKENLLVALFNCKEITSFVTNVPGWTHSGIHLDPTRARQYKIDFRKIS